MMRWTVERIKGLWSKKTLYFLCVLAFNYIEFLRATGNGDVWKTAANCTGLVMMVIIFSNYSIKNFFNKVNYIYTVLCIVAMVVVRLHWKQHIGEYSFWQAETAIMNIWWIGLMLRYLWHQVFIKKQMTVRIGKLGWLWIVMTVWTVVGASDRLWPLWFFFMFGLFYITRFANKDWESLINALVNGTICSFFIIQSHAYLFRPFDEVRYKGAFPNCNSMALYYVIIYVMILIKLHQLHMKKEKWGWKLFYFIGAGGLLSFQFLTICRTAWLTSLVVTVAYGILVVCYKWKESIRKSLARGCMLVLCAMLTFFPVFYTARYLPTIHPHPVWYGDEYNRQKVHSWDPANSEKYVEMDEFLDAALGRIYSLLKMMNAKNPLVLKARAEENIIYVDNMKASQVDSSIKVRMELWKAYLSETTWLGHSPDEANFAWKSNGAYIWHAQNVWVQFAYTYGFPVGVLFVVVTIMLLFRTYRKGMACEKTYGIIPLMICSVFFLYGLAELVWNPGQYILTLFFFVLHPQFLEQNTQEKLLASKECID